MSDLFELKPNEQYSTKVGALVAQLNLVKYNILNKVSGLNVTQLDTEIPGFTNTIGTLLLHMSAMENLHFNIIFLNRTFNQKERKFWHGTIPGEFFPGVISGFDINHYSQIWYKVRENLLLKLLDVEDSWLYSFPKGNMSSMGNNHYLIFHIMEDQLSHFGQIKSMIKLI